MLNKREFMDDTVHGCLVDDPSSAEDWSITLLGLVFVEAYCCWHCVVTIDETHGTFNLMFELDETKTLVECVTEIHDDGNTK